MRDLERFFGSFEFSAVSGIEIGEGSGRILGDPIEKDVTTSPAAAPVSDKRADSGSGNPDGAAVTAVPKKNVLPFRIIAKDRPRYTEAARRAQVNGTVMLKVTLLRNGAVGSITPVTQLSHGLTEQAMIAASRVVFLPKLIDGVPVSVTVTMEYGFTIY